MNQLFSPQFLGNFLSQFGASQEAFPPLQRLGSIAQCVWLHVGQLGHAEVWTNEFICNMRVGFPQATIPRNYKEH